MYEPYLDIAFGDATRRIELTGATTWRIGRGKSTEIHIHDDKASRAHAIVQALPTGAFMVIDCASRNGTFVNGQRVTLPVTVRDGDLLAIGDTRMIFRLPGTASQQASTLSTSINLADIETKPQQRMCEACILVIDVRNYTRLSRQMSDLAVAELVGRWSSQIGRIIELHGSGVDKYFGDAVMAVWTADAGAAGAAVRSALLSACEISRCTAELSAASNLPMPLSIGAGINMGPAVIGPVGPRGHRDYTVLGDTVNMAFRVEAATKTLQCDLAMSEAAYAALMAVSPGGPDLATEQVALKGYEEMATVRSGGFAVVDAWLHQQ